MAPAARLRWLPLWILGVGLALTSALGLWSYQREAAQGRLGLQREAQDLVLSLQNEVQSYIDTLPGLRVFGVLRQAPSDAEFRHYVEAISLEDRYPGLAVTFMAQLVLEPQRERFEAEVRADRSVRAQGHPEFTITPPGPRPSYMVLRHLSPDDPPGFGYDLFDPGQQYREMVEKALSSGRYVATGPLQLARDRNRPADPSLTSIVVRAALYQGGTMPPTEAERKRLAFGVAGIGFRVQPMVRAVLPAHLRDQLRLRLIDEQAAQGGATGLLFDSHPQEAVAPAQALWSGRVRVADRTWQMVTYQHGGGPTQDSTWILVLFGAGLSLALAGMTRALVRANLRADERLRRASAVLRAERDQLRQSEARFRMLFEHSFDAVLRTQPDGKVLAANPAACALFGGSEAELRAAGRERLVDTSDERLASLLEDRRRNGRTAGALRMRRMDGSLFDAEISSNQYTDGDSEISTSMIVRDVTERQRLAARLQEKQRLEGIGTLAGGVSHDFNNMLAAILGNVSLAQADLAPGSPAHGRMQLVLRAAERARALVRQILTFSRRAPQEHALQALQPLLDEAIALLRSTLPPNVQLHVDAAAQPLWARVDGAQVQQMVLNLCTNAWQALDAAGGEVRVSLQPMTLTALDAAPLGLAAGPHAWLRVADDGHGMDEAVRSRIFEPFFTTKPLGQGTGLGLAVVHGVVTDSSGAIRVDSQPGAGTRIDIYLPVLPAPADTPHAVAPAPVTAGGRGERILYVDDDEVVALTAEALLLRAGYAVLCVSSGQAAIDALRAEPGGFAVVLTDFNMPGLSGLAVAEAARELAPDTPVIITTGLITDELQQRARQLGVVEVLPKENMLERLTDTLQRALQALAAAPLPVSTLNSTITAQ